MAIAANTRVRPEKIKAWMKPTKSSRPYTPTVARNGTKNADTKTRISPAVMLPNSLEVKLISRTSSLKASNGPTKKKSSMYWKASRIWNLKRATKPAFKLPSLMHFES